MKRDKKHLGLSTEVTVEHIRGAVFSTELLSCSDYQFYIVKSGEGIYTAGSRTFPFFSGDVLIIPEGTAHKITRYSETVEALRITMPSGYVPEGVRCYFRENAPVIRSEKILPELYTLVSMIEAERDGERAFRKERIQVLSATFVITLARTRSSYVADAEASPAVMTTLTYIKEHSGERISLSDMATLAKVSSAYLSRRFKAEVGMGFADYLASFRLERARTMLLAYPEMSITEIAFSSGFNDSNYFSDKFKKKFGLSPLKYRNSGEI